MAPRPSRISIFRCVGAAGLAGAAALVALLSLSAETDAKTTFDSAYTFEQTFNAALRLVHIDLGLKITERDPAAGYLLFDYRNPESGPRATPGSIEMVPSRDAVVKVVIQLPQMPRYHEQVLMNELVQKLKAEYGEPVRPNTDGRAPARPDGGANDQGD
jgi:hypothetical protein